MKDDEKRLLTHLAHRQGPNGTRVRGEELADECFEKLGIPYKRGEYILSKWAGRGWWNYGVSLRTGWLTAAGLESADS